MNRRQALRSLAGLASVSLAGCSNVTSMRNDTDLQRSVSLAEVDDVPEEQEVEMDVELLQGTINAEQTARLRVTTTNTGRRRAISVSEDMCSLFNRQRGASDEPPGLWLHRPKSEESIERDGEKWVRDRPADDPRAYAAYACLPKVYESGVSVSNEYLLWDDYRVEGYLEPGTSRWEEEVTISEPEEPVDAGSLGRFTWGFSLELQKA